MKKTLLLAAAIPALLFALSQFSGKKPFHTATERALFKGHPAQFSILNSQFSIQNGIPIDSNILFPTAKTCGGCHGFDPHGRALVTTSGEDVNMYDDWRSTMMANASRDPFWRAKVSQEIALNPAHSLALQDKCTSCHAPAGHFQAHLHDHQQFYTLAELYTDTLGLDGVTCQACHAQSPRSAIGNQHSGNVPFDTAKIRVAYGPYEFFFAPPMHQFVGITPVFAEHINDAGLCAACHTLLTESVDLQGVPTGSTFIEQATYHEWLNSKYDEQHQTQTCQNCHVPRINDEIIISENYQFLTPKFPYGLHELAGANVPMLELLKNNRDKLGITATAAMFDSTIAATRRQLQKKTLKLDLKPAKLTGDTAVFDLKLTNMAGHKFPSGYPSRRAWVEFEVENLAGQSLFHSGKMAADGTLPDEDLNFEKHHNDVRKPGDVQIYELVPGDVNGSFTMVLEREVVALKDNRLAPAGFRTDDPAYDTCRIVGDAATDPDFNFSETGAEGSGSDVLHFHIPTTGQDGQWRIRARVWYQSLPPKFVQPLFATSTPEIDSFKTMFEEADFSPVLVGEVALDSVFVQTVATQNIGNQRLARIFPNPTRDGRVYVEVPPGALVRRVQVFDFSGKMVFEKIGCRELVLPERRGVYLVMAETSVARLVEKVVRE